MIERFERALRAFFTEPPKPVMDPSGRDRRLPGTGMPVESIMDAADGHAARQDSALSLMDSDLQGFCLITINGDPAMGMDVNVKAKVRDEHWPGVIGAMANISREVIA